MNKSQTKRALLMSVISMLLCCTMLIGTTFAWFTDSVESGINTIVAGNLDVELYHSNSEVNNKEVTTTTELFKLDKWEPGVVAYENLTVKNVGNLALKYQLSVIAENATVIDGYSLADALKIAVVEGGFEATGEALTRADILNAISADQWVKLASFTQNGQLLSVDAATEEKPAEKTYGVAIYWLPTENDNVFNMNNGKTDKMQIDLGVKLYATQLEAENDSFGKDYDKDAVLPVVMTNNAEEISGLLTKTEAAKVVLLGDVTLEKVNTIAGEKVIDLNGNTLTVTEQKGVTVPENATLTIDNGTIAYTGSDFAPIYVQSNSVVNIEDGAVFDITSAAVAGQWSMAAAVYVNQGSNSVVNINGGIINVTGDNATGVYANYASGGNHTINLNGGVINVEGKNAIGMEVVSKNTLNLNGGVINVKGENALAFNVGQSQGQPTVVAGNGKTVVNLYEGTKLSDDEDAAQFEGVAMTINQAKVLEPNPENPEEVKEQLDNIIKENDSSLVELPKGDYTLPTVSNKDVTIVGDKDTVIDTTAGMPGSSGAALTFEGITINFKEGGSYGTNGFIHAEKIVYKDCIINGTQFLYASEGTEFINCTFNVTGDAYSVWTYGTNATFTGCTFNCDGKAVLIYTEKAVTNTVTFTDCVFNDNGDGTISGKAAIEIGESAYGNLANYTVNIKNCTVNGFDVTGQNASTFGGTDLGTKVWGNKNLMPADRLNVVVDGTEVY